ncbi:GA4 desaturase [Mycena galericulata]|nr:GA4 desaturase [Mycena galericulata]
MASPSIIQASFNYYSLSTPPALDDVSTLSGTSPDITRVVLPVTDLRSLPTPLSSYHHTTHGFQILRQPLPFAPSPATVHDPTVMNAQYYPSIVSLLKKTLDIRSAVVVNHTLRDVAERDPSTFDPKNPRKGADSQPPFFIAHSDYTPGGARAHLRAMIAAWFRETGTEDGSTTLEERAEFFRLREEIIAAEDAAMLGAGLESGDGSGDGKGHWEWDGKGYEGPRYAMFSIWRPWETVRRDPLAVLDAATSDYEYVPLPRTYRNRPGCVPEYYNENVLIRPPPPGEREEHGKHAWRYLSQQQPDEILALKFYDSEALRRGDGSVKLMCPHSAFRIEGMEEEPVRRSCELRVWCIW